MRDLRLAAARHRERFVLARRPVPAVGRVLLSARRPLVVRVGTSSSLRVQVSATVGPSRTVLMAAAAPAAQPPAADPAPTGAVSAPADVARTVAAPGRPGVPATVGRLERLVSRAEHVVTRTEQHIPHVTRVVTHSVVPAGASAAAEPAAEGRRPGPPSSSPQLAAQPAPLDLGLITDHVLTAMDGRLSAYAERLGRG